MELIEGIARGKDPADEVGLKLITVENQDGPERANAPTPTAPSKCRRVTA